MEGVVGRATIKPNAMLNQQPKGNQYLLPRNLLTKRSQPLQQAKKLGNQKQNQVLKEHLEQQQENPLLFKKKIELGKRNSSNNLMIIARIESLIFDKPIKDALDRADKYLQGGADGIMIHSKDKNPKKILKFAEIFRKKFADVPLVAVPSSYNSVKDKQLEDAGFNIVIYANHMLRASYPAMQKVALEILKNGRTYESEKSIMSISNILELIPGTK